MILTVAVIVIMMMVAVMVMVAATFRRAAQLAVQEGRGQFFHGGLRKTRPDGDALLFEQRECAMADAAGDDHARALFADPAGEQPRRVGWRRHGANADDLALLGVGLHEREFSAAAKVSVKPSVGRGNCDGNHGCCLSFIGAGGAVATSISWLHPLRFLVLQPARRNARQKGARPV